MGRNDQTGTVPRGDTASLGLTECELLKLKCKNTVYNTYNIQNICELAVYVLGKGFSQQQALISYVWGGSKVICEFLTMRGLATPTPMLLKGQEYFILKVPSQL